MFCFYVLSEDVNLSELFQHDHYLQVVKTEVITLQRKKDLQILEQYDYMAHSNLIQSTNVPVVKFHYELSPMQVLPSCPDIGLMISIA